MIPTFLLSRIGRYTIMSCIGRGRYGVCFLALDSEGRTVVLKKFRHDMLRRNRHANHYEAVILSALAHPAIPQLLGVINSRKGYFFVLEFMEGSTLRERLFKEKHVFSPEDFYRIGTQLFEILSYLHSQNIVHGDISISNITDDGKHISLLDFGLARYTDGASIVFSLDYARGAEVLLYLLYSGYSGKGSRPWYDELSLTGCQILFLKKLLDPQQSLKDPGELLKDFQEAFCLPAKQELPHG